MDNICAVCQKPLSAEDKGVIREEYGDLFERADFFGMSSLTESEQCIVDYRVHYDCIDGLE